MRKRLLRVKGNYYSALLFFSAASLFIQMPRFFVEKAIPHVICLIANEDN